MLLAAEGLFQTLGLKGNDGRQAINRRLRMLGSGADPEDVLRLLRRKQEPEGFERFYLLKHWPALLRQAGFGLSPAMGLGLLIAFAVLVFLLARIETSLPIAAGIGVVAGLILPVQLLRMKRDLRVMRLSQQLPDTIDLMVRSLRAGHPLNAAFQVIAREMPDPIGSEFGAVADAITYGDELPAALAELAARVGSEDVDYLVVAVSLQHGTGGNLAAVLQTLSQVVRERFAMRRKIKAISAEGRIHDARSDWRAAEAAYRRAIALRPDDATLHNNLGFSLLAAGDSVRAEPSLDRALALDSGLETAATNLRLALALQGRYQPAIAGSAKPDLPRTLNSIAFVAWMRGDEDEASPDFFSEARRMPIGSTALR